MYTNIRFIIERSIGELEKILDEFKKDTTDTTKKDSINKYIRNQYKLLKLKNADISEYNNNLLYIINNLGENNMNDVQVPIMFHEQFLFTAEIYNRVKLAQEIKQEFCNIDDHMMLGYVPLPDQPGAHGGYATADQ